MKKTDERHDAAWEHSLAVLDTCTTHTQANSASYPQLHTHARWLNGLSMRIRVIKVIWIITPCCSFSAFTLLAGQQKCMQPIKSCFTNPKDSENQASHTKDKQQYFGEMCCFKNICSFYTECCIDSVYQMQIKLTKYNKNI